MLFRPEALQGRQQAWLGSIQLLQPLSLKLLSAAAITAILLICTFLSLAEYTRKARVSGYLVPDRGVLRISATHAATVLQREVSEGQVVKQGDVLFVLALDSANQAEAGIAQNLILRQQSLQATSEQQRQLVRTQQLALEQRRAGLLRELGQMQAETALHEERLVLAREALARLQSLSHV